jgi:hypothetical protein
MRYTMSRTKGSKNKPKNTEQFKNTVVKTKELEKHVKIATALQPVGPGIGKEGERAANKPIIERSIKQSREPEVLKVESITPRKESPKIPEVLIDGGMLYRWLIELRRHYDELTQDDNKDTKKRVYQIIDEITNYIMRMEKK